MSDAVPNGTLTRKNDRKDYGRRLRNRDKSKFGSYSTLSDLAGTNRSLWLAKLKSTSLPQIFPPTLYGAWLLPQGQELLDEKVESAPPVEVKGPPTKKAKYDRTYSKLRPLHTIANTAFFRETVSAS